jgi:hypothetical protein
LCRYFVSSRYCRPSRNDFWVSSDVFHGNLSRILCIHWKLSVTCFKLWVILDWWFGHYRWIRRLEVAFSQPLGTLRLELVV